MNTKNIAITTGVVASVIGLGFLSYFLFSKKEIAIEESNEQVDPSLPISQPEKMIEAINVSDNKKVDIEENPERFTYVEMGTHIPKVNGEIVEYFDEEDVLEFPFDTVETANDVITTTTEKQEIIEEVSSLKKELISDEFPLQLGSKGKRVERLQIWLLRNYGYTGQLTKVFDEETLSLVEKHLKTKTIDEKRYQQLEIAKPVYEQATIK